MEFRNIGELLEARGTGSPEKKFLFSEIDEREWTYAEFDRVIRQAANRLLACGIGKGDVVSLLLPNSPEYIAAYFACWKIGAVAGPVNSLLKAEEIEWVIANSESKLLITSSAILSEPPVITSGSPEAGVLSEPSLAPETVGENPFDLFGVPCLTFDDLELTVGNSSDDRAAPTLAPDDDAIIIYTSGTTGKPKGCLLTHGNLLANAQQITEWLGFGPDDRLLTVMPLFHMNAVTVTTMTALYCGGSTVVSPKFSASRFWDIIDKYKITSFGSVATMLSMLMERRQPRGEPAGSRCSLKFAMCGSAPVPAEVLKRFEDTFGTLVIEGYGLSESTCRSTFNPPNQCRRPGSCGKPIGNEMKIFDEEDNEVKDGELGEIVLRGPNIFKGYFKNPGATASAFANGWFHTGDIGYRDADGFFYIADRKSDMIIRGGENIYPREIDDLLYTHPAVAAAAVIGVPDNLYGEEVAAFIVLKDGYTHVGGSHVSKGSPSSITGSSAVSELDEQAEPRPVGSVPDEPQVTAQDIINFCKLHLADYKCPKTVHFIDDIPKGATGKLLKRELAKLYAKARE